MTFGGYRFGFKVTFRLLSKLFRPKDFFAKKNFLNFFFQSNTFSGDIQEAFRGYGDGFEVTFRLH